MMAHKERGALFTPVVERYSVYKNTYTSDQISDLKDKMILAILN